MFKLFAVLCFSLVFINSSFAIDPRTNREKIAVARAKKFLKNSDKSRQNALVSGNYNSDYNSKEYQLDLRYFYQSSKQIHEFYFLRELYFADSGSGTNKKYMVKKSNLWDFTLSNKFLLGESKNYIVSYNRADIDELASYQRDYRSAAGLGRLFLNDKLEIDGSIGFNKNKNYGDRYFFLPSLRLNLQLSEKLNLSQRAFYFINKESSDSEIRTTLKYRIDSDVSFSVNHSFEQRRYGQSKTQKSINQSKRTITLGFAFDL